MSKPLVIEESALPDIDKQIEYVKHFRKDVLPLIKPLQTETEMVYAIEQSLLAAKLLVAGKENGKDSA